MNTRITFLRHGATDANAGRLFSGANDLPLNRVGIGEAHEAAQNLRDAKYDVLAHGGRTRVMQTARIVLDALVHKPGIIIVHPGIREMDFGVFEGMGNGEIEVKYPAEWEDYLANWQDFNFPCGDNSREFFEDCGNTARSLAEEYSGMNILITAHKGFILCAMACLEGRGIGGMFDLDITTGGTLEIVL